MHPLELYDTPANVFVASFIGLPPMNFFDALVSGDTLEVEGLSIPLSEEEAGRLRPYDGKFITLGVRPENVDHGSDLAIKVSGCENLGQTTLVHGTLAGHKITAKLREWGSYAIGEELSVSFTRMHFFDKETTNRI